MRMVRWMGIVAVGWVCMTSTMASAQGSRRMTKPPQRTQRVATTNENTQRVAAAERSARPAPRAAQSAELAQPEKAATGVDLRIADQIRSMEASIEQAGQVLQRRMAQANQIRQQGLKKEDRKLLDQAEQMERQAIAAYEQQLQQLETISQRISTNSKAIAEQTAQRANQSNAQVPTDDRQDRPAASRAPSNSRQPTPTRYYNRGRGR